MLRLLIDVKNQLLTLNLSCLIVIIWLIYKHYFYDIGKGFDEYILALSLYSFCSFFALLANMNFKIKSVKLLLLFLGLAYLIFIAIYLEHEILNGQGMLSFIIFLSLIPLFLFCILIIFSKKITVSKICTNILSIFSIITSIIPICFLGLSILGAIFTL